MHSPRVGNREVVSGRAGEVPFRKSRDAGRAMIE